MGRKGQGFEEQRDPVEARGAEAEVGGEQTSEGGRFKPGGGVDYSAPSIPAWCPVSSALALPPQDIQGFGVPLNVSPEPHEAKNAKLWPTLR